MNPLNNAPYDRALPHLDPSDPMWALDASEREHALELIGQLAQTRFGGRGTVVLQSVAANEVEAREAQERQARGFYTLQEATRIVAEANPDVNERRLLAQLLDAAKHGQLLVRDPETQAPVRDRGAILEFWHWVKPDDLDALFAAWGVTYRFPKSDAAGGTEKVPRVPAAEAQDKSILAKLRELGFDPMALPKCKPGAASPAKKAIKDSAMYTPSVVDHAWKRLRKGGKLREA